MQENNNNLQMKNKRRGRPRKNQIIDNLDKNKKKNLLIKIIFLKH